MGLIRILFSKYKYLVHTVFGNEKYFKVVNKLKVAGIRYQTDIFRNPNTYQSIGHNDNAQYNIYVKEEDKHKAQQAINS